MGKLTRTEVEQIATLARLRLSSDELERMVDDLGAILGHFAAIAVADTNDVPAMTHAVPAETALRPDVVAPSLPTADALRAAPQRDGDLIVVPAIIPGTS